MAWNMGYKFGGANSRSSSVINPHGEPSLLLILTWPLERRGLDRPGPGVVQRRNAAVFDLELDLALYLKAPRFERSLLRQSCGVRRRRNKGAPLRRACAAAWVATWITLFVYVICVATCAAACARPINLRAVPQLPERSEGQNFGAFHPLG